MIIETVFTAENKRERKALLMMQAAMQDAGMDVEFHDNWTADKDNTKDAGRFVELRVNESRRKRKTAAEPQASS